MSPDDAGNEQNVSGTSAFHSCFKSLGISPDAHAIPLAALDGKQECILQMTAEVLLDLIGERFSVALFEGRHESLQVDRTSSEYYGTA